MTRPFPPFEKWSTLAGLRFLLASIVAVNHLPDFVPIGVWAFIPRFGAFEAILGFLLISGYSVGASYLKEPDKFVMRRAKRIYPVYLAAVVLASLVYVMTHGSGPSIWTLVINVLFLNQILTADSFVGPAWTLALEVWLYALTPLLFRLRDSVLERMVYLSFASYVAYTCGRTLFHWPYYAGLGYGLNLLLLSFIWIAGLRLSRNSLNHTPVLRQAGLIFAAHIALATAIQFASRWKNDAVRDFFYQDLIGYVLQASTLGFVLWIFQSLLATPPDAGIQRKPAVWLRLLGDVSYPLYVVHMSVYFLFRGAGLQSPVLYYLGAVAVSYLIYKTLDRYSQRRHLSPSLVK